MSNSDLLNIINKPWLDINDIKLIANCGDSSARRIVENINTMVVDEGKILPPSKTKMVPTKLVLDYLGIDINFIIETTKVLEEKNYVS